LKQVHNKTLADYIIEFEYNNIAPKCKCGLCEDIPLFHRGKFTRYAKRHSNTEWIINRYIKLFGKPKCKYCGKECGFKRKKPHKYCSIKCAALDNGGFTKKEVQDNIKTIIQSKYGVNNVSKLDFVRDKISKANKGKYKPPATEETKLKNSISSKKKWTDPDYRRRVCKSIKIALNTKEQKDKRKRIAIEKCKDIAYLQKQVAKLLSGNKKLSKVHIKIRDKLNLQALGFISEQPIGKYVVDELNDKEKIIIEINGDYIHANPKIFKDSDTIYLPGNKYTAKEKWNKDNSRKEKLEKMGYRVIIIWESDNLNDIKIF
jgi:very-short-patch-repair endonuclease